MLSFHLGVLFGFVLCGMLFAVISYIIDEVNEIKNELKERKVRRNAKQNTGRRCRTQRKRK